MANRLASENSPYLLQHKDNPVDWYPWGREAFDEAARRDVPVLLSVGYAACHWCHVMEHESFEDDATAALMNENFVSIKVDREERPDVDSVYMDSVQAMSGQGGWPMTVFLTAEGVPFYGGTYFPPEPRHGMPSFKQLLVAITDTWHNRREEVEQQGEKLVEHIGQIGTLSASTGDITADVLDEALRGLSVSFDEQFGGFGGAPKFPQPMNVDLLLRLARRGNEDASNMALRTLGAMSSGGMFDQLGGGFARYSVDATWTVPHFEKMLYDNAQLLRSYARAFAATDVVRFKEVAEMTARWLLAEMRDEGGGFYSSLDADSEGEEGKFYVFSLDEVRAVLGDDAGLAIEAFGFTEEGNFEGSNIPVYAQEPADVDASNEARSRLLAYRDQRVRPGTDTKVLTSWNALAASALAEAGALLGKPEWIAAAVEAMHFISSTLIVEGRMMRSYRRTEDGRAQVKHLGCAEDYAFFLEACLTLWETTFDERWLLEKARWAADEAIRLFHDDANGGFFTTGTDAEKLIVRPKDLFDNAVPSANSVLALELQRLALLTGRKDLEDVALGAMKLLSDAAGRSPLGFGALLSAMEFYTGDPVEVVIVGRGSDDLTQAVQRTYWPSKVVVAIEEPRADVAGDIPLLEGRTEPDGPTAYVCRRGVCELPVHDAESMFSQIEGP
ncbi:MAG: thioredoxin domain-containing protein [Actinomycetota bacterium]|nr:thioredoxin domain-containing protein [Actinomycetota bacterium]